MGEGQRDGCGTKWSILSIAAALGLSLCLLGAAVVQRRELLTLKERLSSLETARDHHVQKVREIG